MLITPRRRLLVSRFQYALLAHNVSYFLAVVGVVYGASVVPLVLALDTEGVDADTQARAGAVLLHLHTWVLPALVPVLVLMGWHSVVVTHRIAGPIYRLSAVMRAMASGDLRVHAQIRERDYLWKEAREMQDLLAFLNREMWSLRGACHGVREAARAVADAVKDEETADALAAGDELLVQTGRLESALDAFDLSDPPHEVGDVPDQAHASPARLPRRSA